MIGEEMANYAANKALRKLGISEKSERAYLLEETEIVAQDSDGYYFYGVAPAIVTIPENKSFTVAYDGVTYECTAVTANVNAMVTGVFIGNLSLEYMGDDTGEPFLIMFLAANNSNLFTVKAPGTHTVAIYTQTETITPIDPKYLPGVCLPVVEIADFTALTEAEQAKLTACIGMPIVLKCELGPGVPVAVVMTYGFTGEHQFVGQIGGGKIDATLIDGEEWHISIGEA